MREPDTDDLDVRLTDALQDNALLTLAHLGTLVVLSTPFARGAVPVERLSNRSD